MSPPQAQSDSQRLSLEKENWIKMENVSKQALVLYFWSFIRNINRWLLLSLFICHFFCIFLNKYFLVACLGYILTHKITFLIWPCAVKMSPSAPFPEFFLPTWESLPSSTFDHKTVHSRLQNFQLWIVLKTGPKESLLSPRSTVELGAGRPGAGPSTRGAYTLSLNFSR